jgi:hypothetical protein
VSVVPWSSRDFNFESKPVELEFSSLVRDVKEGCEREPKDGKPSKDEMLWPPLLCEDDDVLWPLLL